jgi:predicted nucleotidyltransferase
MEKKLSDLSEKLKAAFAERLVAVILYGSAAMDDWQARGSDLNVLCVLQQITRKELKESEPVFKWWRELGNPPAFVAERGRSEAIDRLLSDGIS